MYVRVPVRTPDHPLTYWDPTRDPASARLDDAQAGETPGQARSSATAKLLQAAALQHAAMLLHDLAGRMQEDPGAAPDITPQLSSTLLPPSDV